MTSKLTDHPDRPRDTAPAPVDVDTDAEADGPGSSDRPANPDGDTLAPATGAGTSTGTATGTGVAPRRALRLPTFGLSATQLVATALAAVTATFAASFLGVAGTVVGAALFSVLTAAGKEVYGQSLSRTRDRVRDAVPATRPRPAPTTRAAATRSLPTTASRPVPDAAPELPSAGRRAPRADRVMWRRAALAATTLFVAVCAVVTTVELLAGEPVSDLVRGDSGHGTSFFGGQTHATRTVPPVAPTVTITVTPSVVVTTPTVTRTAPARTATTTPSTTTSSSATSSSSASTDSGDANGTPNHRTASASGSASP